MLTDCEHPDSWGSYFWTPAEKKVVTKKNPKNQNTLSPKAEPDVVTKRVKLTQYEL